MKKLLILLLLTALLTTLAACGLPEETDRLSVVATLFPQYDFARNIAGDGRFFGNDDNLTHDSASFIHWFVKMIHVLYHIARDS